MTLTPATSFSQVIALCAAGLFPLAAQGQSAEAETVSDAEPAALSIELSAADDVGSACRMSFLVRNGTGGDISQAVYEMVLFGREGQVALMTLLDFQELPSGRPRVRQFQFDGLACADISRVLINGAETCDGPAAGACIDGLELSTRTGTELIG